MLVTPLHTDVIRNGERSLLDVVKQYLPPLQEKQVVAITSKIVSLCEGLTVPIQDSSKAALAYQEADFYLKAEDNPYHQVLAIKDSALIIAAGVDARNTGGYYVKLPNAVRAARIVWEYLRSEGNDEIGVIVTDSHTTPMRTGVTGISLGYCGFVGVNHNHNALDVFGQTMSESVHVADALAAAAVFAMGETNEQTPLAVISNIPHIQFRSAPPAEEELREAYLPLDTDIYAPMLKSAPWQVGGKS